MAACPAAPYMARPACVDPVTVLSVVTRRLTSTVEEEQSQDFEVRLNRDDRPLGATGLQDALRSADALLCTVTDRLTADVLEAEPLRARLLPPNSTR